jgi:hypothetical protein
VKGAVASLALELVEGIRAGFRQHACIVPAADPAPLGSTVGASVALVLALDAMQRTVGSVHASNKGDGEENSADNSQSLQPENNTAHVHTCTGRVLRARGGAFKKRCA